MISEEIMAIHRTLSLTPDLENEVTAAVESGMYESKEDLIHDAVYTLMAARPDLRIAVACKLYESGDFSLGKASEWSGLSIEAMKEELRQRGIERRVDDSAVDIERMAQKALQQSNRVK
jgi:predicted HTH domain antitoxin